MATSTAKGKSGSGRYPTLERIVQSVTVLKGTGLGRLDATMFRWLILKREGFPDDEVDVTTEVVKSFAEDFFGMPSSTDYSYFNPFSEVWYLGASTDWAVQTVYTQFGRINQREQEMYKFPESVSVTVDGESRQAYKIKAKPDYLEGLSGLLRPGVRVSAVELALWRYRRECFAGEPSTDDLVNKLKGELRVTEEEFEAVFV
jgi:hypothetical protein